MFWGGGGEGGGGSSFIWCISVLIDAPERSWFCCLFHISFLETDTSLFWCHEAVNQQLCLCWGGWGAGGLGGGVLGWGGGAGGGSEGWSVACRTASSIHLRLLPLKQASGKQPCCPNHPWPPLTPPLTLMKAAFKRGPVIRWHRIHEPERLAAEISLKTLRW